MSNENVKVEKVKVEKVSAHQPAFVDVNSFALMDKECSALGGLFQSVVNDMKGSYIVFEDFAAKALKLHQHLKVTSLAAAAFLDSFQRVADMATGTKGATREIGSALTRICMRHRNIETKLKQFTVALAENLVLPLQDRVEEWKKIAVQMDKDHAKEYKRNRHELKKLASDTGRLQKKAKKGKPESQKQLERHLQALREKYCVLNETEKNAVRQVMIEERSRYCFFVQCLRPAVEIEIEMLGEITHLEEILDSLKRHSADPKSLPDTSEHVIRDLKSSDTTSFFQTPPSSPSSVGSRKSSMCSLSSMTSSSSAGSNKSSSHHSPSHHNARYHRNLLHANNAAGGGGGGGGGGGAHHGGGATTQHATHQVAHGGVRLSSASSQDSGFISQDTLFHRPATPPPLDLTTQASLKESGGSTGTSSNTSTPSSPYPSSLSWPAWEENLEKAVATMPDRPHTISSPYERHQQQGGSSSRPLLTAQTFQPLERSLSERHAASSESSRTPTPRQMTRSHEQSFPTECPPAVARNGQVDGRHQVECPRQLSTESTTPTQEYVSNSIVMQSDVPNFNQSATDQIVPQPVYMNVGELQANMAASQAANRPRSAGARMMHEHHGMRIHNPTGGSSPRSSVYSCHGDGNSSSEEYGTTEEFTAIYNDIENEFGKYCTLPGRNSDVSRQLRAQRPCSYSGYPAHVSSPHGGGSPKRGISSKTPPPVPVRRTSAATNNRSYLVGKVPATYLRSHNLHGGDQRSSSSEDLGAAVDSPESTAPPGDDAVFSHRLVQSFNVGERHGGRGDPAEGASGHYAPPQRRHSDLSDHFSLLGNRDEEDEEQMSRYRHGTKQTDV